MRGLNRVTLMGLVGQDVEVRFTQGGTAVANVRMATSESWNDKETGERRERTEWHTVVFYGRLAEIAGEYVRKGKPIYVEGPLRTRKWQDRDGNDRYSTEVVGNELQLLGERSRSTQEDGAGETFARNEKRGNGAHAAQQQAPDPFEGDSPPF